MPAISERISEVRDIAAVLWFLPPPARAEIADKLHGLGIRMHPDLATLELEMLGPKSLGVHRQAHPVAKGVFEQAQEILGQVNPELARRIAAARTDQEKASLAAELKEQMPADWQHIAGQIDKGNFDGTP